MLDHVSLVVSDYARSVAFYRRALAPLGIEVRMEDDNASGFGQGRRSFFWILGRSAPEQPTSARTHIAFVATDQAAVRAFYSEAIAAGGTDNGPPGLRPQYHAGYYGAFVLDPDGHNIEAVFRGKA